MSLWEKFHDDAPHTVAAQLRIITGFPTHSLSLYNFIFIYCYSNYILIFLFIQSFICFYSYLFYIHSFYTIRLMHNIFFTISHQHTNAFKELPSPFSERQFFFLLFSSYYSVLIVKVLSHSPFGSGHHLQKLKRIPASILHLFDRSAPKFLV